MAKTPLQQEYAIMPPVVRGAVAATVLLAALGAAGAALLPALARRPSSPQRNRRRTPG